MLDLSGVKNLAITGANGFVGKSIVETVGTLREEFLPERITLITRNGVNYEIPKDLDRRVSKVSQDLTIPWSFHSDVTHIINLAADGTKSPYSDEACIQFEQISTNLVNWLNKFDSQVVVFHASSGACYGLYNLDGDSNSKNTKANFAENRIKVENYLIERESDSNYVLSIGRLFSFSGKNLISKRHYALSNFVHSALKFNEIKVTGNPLTQRSYLHQDAMSKWIIKALLNPEPHTDLQIGSNQAITIKELAEFISEVTDAAIKYSENPDIEDIYIPNNEDTRIKLGVDEGLGWKEAVLEMISEERVFNNVS